MVHFPPNNLVVCGQSELPHYLDQHGVPPAVLSIDHPGACPKTGKAEALGNRAHAQLTLTFWDIEQNIENAPSADDLETGLDFLRAHKDHGLIVVHCKVGMCRSAAFALAHFAEILGAGKESQAVEHLIQIRPIAAPNLRMVSLADRRLKRGGRLLDATLRHAEVQRNLEIAHAARMQWVAANPDFDRTRLGGQGLIPMYLVLSAARGHAQ